ncbi:MAG: TonB family protein [Opitutaceae bacterium]|nr:TonB family protein [Opitutaceae bacterium]
MSSSTSPVCFAELNDFSLLLARGAATGRTVRLEALAEIPLVNAAALAEAVRAITSAGGELTAGLRPAERRLLTGKADDASGANLFASGATPWAAATRARDGATPDGSPSLVALASPDSHSGAIGTLTGLGLKPTHLASATHHAIGAVARLATMPTLLFDIGERYSHAILIESGGATAASGVSLRLDEIAEAVQAELGMKFRGSAVKLLFNPDYDFSETAPKIAARLAATLRPELAALRGATPAVLACSGLPAAQHWLANSLATALELTPFAPDLRAWCTASGISFASSDLEATATPAWAGFLNLVASRAAGFNAAWHTPWQLSSKESRQPPASPSAEKTPPPSTATAAPASTPAAAPAAPDAAKAAPTSSPAIISVKTVPASKPAAPVPQPKPAAPVPVAKAATPVPEKSVAAAVAAPAARSAGTSSVTYPAKGTTSSAPKNQAKKQPEPAPAKSMIAAAAAKAATPPPPAKNTAAPAAAQSPATPRSKRNLLWIIGAALVVGLGISGALMWKAKHDEETRIAAELARIESVRLAEVERQRKAEEQARIEAETRRKIELEHAQKLAAAEAARQQAENEARIQAAARLAAARGTITIGSPVGATVTVGDLPPRTAPATFTDLKLGRYPVTVSLEHHEPVRLELEVKENETTDAGQVRLVRLVGTLILTSEPGDANYEVRPASAPTGDVSGVRTGRTPVTFSDIAPGDYIVTFTREGWQAHTENVTIGRDSTVRAACAFRTGIVKLTTSPAGAAVTLAGQNLGVTPLTLLEQNPGTVTFEITLPGHDPATVEARIEPGQIINIEHTLEAEDRLVRLSDADERPIAILTPQPEIPLQRGQGPMQIDIALTVDRDGNPRDIQLVKAPNPAVGKLCVEAAAKWKFKPATVNGKPVNVRVAIPFSITPAQ